jgi:hypothetical protein
MLFQDTKLLEGRDACCARETALSTKTMFHCRGAPIERPGPSHPLIDFGAHAQNAAVGTLPGCAEYAIFYDVVIHAKDALVRAN